jgi:hypothetical protein
LKEKLQKLAAARAEKIFLDLPPLVATLRLALI